MKFLNKETHTPVLLMKYHSARNQFERFRGVLELISRFEFEFRRRGNYFLNGSNFWCVQSSITHTMWAVNVHVWPVCAHTIPFRMLWCPSRFMMTYIYIYFVYFICICTCICVYICLYICVCVFVCSVLCVVCCCVQLWVVVCHGEGSLRRATSGETLAEKRYWRANRSVYLEKGAIDQPNSLAACFPQDSWRRTASSGKAND